MPRIKVTCKVTQKDLDGLSANPSPNVMELNDLLKTVVQRQVIDKVAEATATMPMIKIVDPTCTDRINPDPLWRSIYLTYAVARKFRPYGGQPLKPFTFSFFYRQEGVVIKPVRMRRIKAKEASDGIPA